MLQSKNLMVPPCLFYLTTIYAAKMTHSQSELLPANVPVNTDPATQKKKRTTNPGVRVQVRPVPQRLHPFMLLTSPQESGRVRS